MRKVKNVFVRVILAVWYIIKMMWFKMNVFYWVHARHYAPTEFVDKYGDLYTKLFLRDGYLKHSTVKEYINKYVNLLNKTLNRYGVYISEERIQKIMYQSFLNVVRRKGENYVENESK